MKTEYAAHLALTNAYEERQRWIKALTKPAPKRTIGFWAKLWKWIK